MGLELALRALLSGRRLRIVDWLKHPVRHFPPQIDGDRVDDGVCGLLIATKLRVSQPTASEHLKILMQGRADPRQADQTMDILQARRVPYPQNQETYFS
jgi:DNA-binding transcriptional ArsR family regulator